MTAQRQDNDPGTADIAAYRRDVAPGADRRTAARMAVLAVAETLTRLGRELPIRVHVADRAADFARLPVTLRDLPAVAAGARLPGLRTHAIGRPPAGGLALRVGGGGVDAGAAAVRIRCLLGADLQVLVDCTPGDSWRRCTAAVAEMVAEILAGLLADPALRPADATAIGPVSRHRALTELAGRRVDHGPFRSLAALVEEQVDADSERPAVVHAAATLTYGRLDRLANAVAGQLAAEGVGKGDVVPLLLGNSLELPVSCLALLKLGAAFVPLDPQWPELRLAAALDVLRAPVTVTAGEPVPAGRALTVRVAALVEEPDRPAVEIGPADLAYGVFTSGTTGTPRCALNHHGGLVNRLHFMTRWFGPPPLGGEVVLQNSKHTFDSAVWQLFWPLTTGGRTVVPATGGFLDLQQTVETLALHGVTVTDFVPTTFNLLVGRLARDPEALRRVSSLRHLVVGGEEISPRQVHRLRELLPGLRVSNAYGPSETAIGMVFHPVAAEDGDDVPLGRPIDNCAAVVVDDGLRPLPPGAVGEIAIGGVCVGAGYLGAPESTAAKFVPSPFPEVLGDRLYRSGDLGWYDPDGRLHFAGRTDFQTKVGGVRVELGEIQAAAQSHPGIRQALVLVAGTDAAQGLAVFAAADDDVTEQDLRDHLRRLLPRTSLPRHVVLLPELPLADSAKVDRSVLVDLLEVRLAEAATVGADAGPTDADGVLSAFRVALADPALPADADFLAAGGDSLRAVSLVGALRAGLGVDVGVQDLLEHPTAEAMIGFLERQRTETDVPPDVQAAMDADTMAPLPAPLVPAAEQVALERVLLTGATGFVGAQLAYELLTRTEAEVLCLIRAFDDQDARDRLVATLAVRGLWRDEWSGRLVAVAGALDRPSLGLDPEAWDRLAGADVVLHSGARVNFLYDYRAHRGPNVLAVDALLQIARHGAPAPLVHLSTLGVLDRDAALREEPTPEDVDLERILPPESGYSQSKWVAERRLTRARGAGATVTMLRLGEVMPAAGGTANPRALTHLLLTAFARLRACPDIQLWTDCTPVDWAARVTVAALTDPAARGRDLHVFHPKPVSLTDLLPQAGVPLERLPVAEFRRRVEGGTGPELTTLAGMLRGLPDDGLDRLVVDNPRLFRADAGMRLAEQAGLPPADLGPAIRGYVQWLLAEAADAEEAACANG
ncbi:MAG TPA: amino acid adenylation domain-containing protein [Mycobacteriales bacterium]